MNRSKIIKNLKRIRGSLASMQKSTKNPDDSNALAHLAEGVVNLIQKLQSSKGERDLT